MSIKCFFYAFKSLFVFSVFLARDLFVSATFKNKEIKEYFIFCLYFKLVITLIFNNIYFTESCLSSNKFE